MGLAVLLYQSTVNLVVKEVIRAEDGPLDLLL